MYTFCISDSPIAKISVIAHSMFPMNIFSLHYSGPGRRNGDFMHQHKPVIGWRLPQRVA
jgi:hypothetical protein